MESESQSSEDSTMENPTCSHWWHAPFYIATSLTLVYIAIATVHHPTPAHPLPRGPVHAINASRALRHRGGYHIIAALMQISPDLFFPAPESTVFAIQDSVISNLSVPPWDMRQLLRYHTAPSALPMSELRKKLPGFCFKTLAENKTLAVTKNGGGGPIEINDVLISQPDLFLEGPIAVHGIAGSFDMAAAPLPCLGSINRTAVEWADIVRSLSSNGFVAFAIGLNAVVDGIVEDYQNLESVTIFAPPNSGFMISSSSPYLERIVRIHIVPRKYSYVELVSMEDSSLATLMNGFDLKMQKMEKNVVINGVEITRGDMFSSKTFVIHGISGDFDLGNTFK